MEKHLATLGTWLLTAPIWLIGFAIYGGMVAAAFIGWRLRARTEPKGETRSHNEEGYVVSSVMGLLALLVGFTFALAIDRYDTRRQLVLDEANAIGTTYLRTQLLDEPHRSRISRLLEAYTDNRIDLARSGKGEAMDARLARSNQLVTQLWSATVDAFPAMETRPLSSAYISSMNEMIDMDSARQQSRRTHVPLEVFVMLLAYQIIASGVLGYVLAGRRGRTTASLLLILFGGTLLLVIDIDRPTSGGIVEDQKPMLELQSTIKAQPPGSYGNVSRLPADQRR